MEHISAAQLVIRWAAAVLSFLGVIVGVWGTLLMSRSFHPYKTWGVISHVMNVAFTAIFKGHKAAEDLNSDAADLVVNQENHARSLAGLCILVTSFFFQTIGAVLVMIDLAWPKK